MSDEYRFFSPPDYIPENKGDIYTVVTHLKNLNYSKYVRNASNTSTIKYRCSVCFDFLILIPFCGSNYLQCHQCLITVMYSALFAIFLFI